MREMERLTHKERVKGARQLLFKTTELKKTDTEKQVGFIAPLEPLFMKIKPRGLFMCLSMCVLVHPPFCSCLHLWVARVFALHVCVQGENKYICHKHTARGGWDV